MPRKRRASVCQKKKYEWKKKTKHDDSSDDLYAKGQLKDHCYVKSQEPLHCDYETTPVADLTVEVESEPSPFDALCADIQGSNLMTTQYFISFGKDIQIMEMYNHSPSRASVKLCVVIDSNLTASTYVHRKEVSKDNPCWDGLPRTFCSAKSVEQLLSRLNAFSVCVGNSDEDFQTITPVDCSVSSCVTSEIVAFREGDFCATKGNLTYNSSIRSVNCALLVEGNRCRPCLDVRRMLMKRCQREEERQHNAVNKNFVHSRTAHKVMSRENLLTKISQQRQEIKNLSSQVEKLRRQCEKEIHAKGVQLDPIESVEMKDFMALIIALWLKRSRDFEGCHSVTMEGMKEDQHGSIENTSASSCKITTQGDGMEAVVASEKDSFRTPASTESKTQDGNEFKVPVNFPFKKPVFISRTQRLNTKHDESKSKSEEGLEEGRKTVSELSDESKSTKTAPAKQLVEKIVPLPYKEPSWSGEPTAEYSFEVIKNGTIVDMIPLNKPFLVVGRLAQCDIIMEHPSLSRFHCVIQYCLEGSEAYPQGFYAYDLGSTHGSFHNKHPMKPRTYHHLRVGHMLKFGGSTRMLILQGPEEDQEPESELSVTELKAKSAEHAKKLEQLEMGEVEEEDQEQRMKEETAENDKAQEDSRGIDWGMGEDAEDEEEADGENPFASLNEELYLEDPKKTLRGWFEREGYDPPNYDTEDISPGFYKCKLELPVPGPGGGPLVAIVEHKGKKKEAVIQCALEACRLLDKLGVLRQAKHESHERKRRDWAENDYYDSDEDDFLDRTGDVQRKRIRRMKEAGGKDSGFVENYETLITKYKEVTKELEELEEKLAKADFLKQFSENSSGADEDLDTYMHKLKSQVPDKHKRVTWKLRAVELRKDELRLRRLTNIARPLGVPELQAYQSKHGTSSIKQNLKVEFVGEKQKDLQRTMFGATKPKESFKVHKIFLEDEPEHKPRLRRLDDEDDDDDDELPSSRHATIPHKVKSMRQHVTYDTVIEKPEMIIPGSSKNKIQVQEHKHSSDQSFEDDKHSISGCRTVKKPEIPLQKLEQIGTGKQSGKDANDCGSGENLQCKGDSAHKVSTSNKETETNGSSNSTHEWKRPVTPENSFRKKSSSKGTEESPPEKKQRLVGPTLPPNLAQLRTEQQDYTRKKKKQEKKSRKYDDDNPNYDTWIPPQQQTGDGRTSLNDKLGY